MDREESARRNAVDEVRDLLEELRCVLQQARPSGDVEFAELRMSGVRADDVILLVQPIRLTDSNQRVREQDGTLDATLQRLAEKNFLSGAWPIAEGGVAAALGRACAFRGLGFHVDLTESEGASAADALLGERSGRALVSSRAKAHLPLTNFVERGGALTAEAIGRVTKGDVRVCWMGETVLKTVRMALLEGLS